MIKQILFDCGDVLAHIRFDNLITELTGDPKQGQIVLERMWIQGSPWLRYDRGLYQKSEMLPLLIDYYPEIAPEHLEQFMQLWPTRMQPIQEMELLIKDLRTAGYPCYLLSNFNPQFEELRPHCPALQLMDGEVVSYNINMLKPDREIFEHTAEKFGILPGETLFIDDTQANIDAAIEAGYLGHLFTDASTLRSALKDLHILDE